MCQKIFVLILFWISVALFIIGFYGFKQFYNYRQRIHINFHVKKSDKTSYFKVTLEAKENESLGCERKFDKNHKNKRIWN